MLEKIINIENIGKFKKFSGSSSAEWDGGLRKITTIYAPNGSGKTTFSLIMQSLAGKSGLLKRKQSFKDENSASGEQSVSLRFDGEIIKYKNGSWSLRKNNIEVFNIHFIEDNLFSGSVQSQKTRQSLFSLINSEATRDLAARSSTLDGEIKRLRSEQSLKKRMGKKDGSYYTPKFRDSAKEYGMTMNLLRQQRSEINNEIGKAAQAAFAAFIAETNKHLKKFSAALSLEKISNSIENESTFYVKCGSNRITFDENAPHQFKYTLSEAERSALAFSMFLAKISLRNNIEELVVVFDDPVSSFDSSRRFVTINDLVILASKVGQLIVLTHDNVFASELEARAGTDAVSLSLQSDINGVKFSHVRHSDGTLSGMTRDIRSVTNFLKFGGTDQGQMVGVARCLRPILEGIARIKYWDVFSGLQWLGDFIKMIRTADEHSILSRLKRDEIYEELVAINNYSSPFHHSSPGSITPLIDEAELRIMATRTLNVLRLI
jgi:wobble nucleotide-excising tRNase